MNKTMRRQFSRAVVMLLLMLLTATTAWAFKAETTAYSMTFNCSTEFVA